MRVDKGGKLNVYNGVAFTDSRDIECIVNNAFSILSKTGVLVESAEFEKRLLDYSDGFFKSGNRVMMKPSLSHKCFEFGMGKVTAHAPYVTAGVEIYEGPYLDPMDGQYKTFTHERLLDYIKLSQRLTGITGISMLGCPLPMNLSEKPLYEKLYNFKYGLSGGYSIWDSNLCPKLLDMWQLYAEEVGKPVNEVFLGGAYMLSPLRLGSVEAEQVLWFAQRGLRVSLGSLSSMGLTTPITPAGAISINIAERLFLSAVDWALFGIEEFSLNGGIAVADMRSGMFQYGRPEEVLISNAMSDIAAYYGIAYSGHGGLTDAKKPGFEAGVQKAASAMANLMKGRNANIAAGLLSIDEVCSPVQMVLDAELAQYLGQVARGFQINEETLALDAIDECARSTGVFLAEEHTVDNYCACTWMPRLFSKDMLANFLENPITATERARELALEIIHDSYPLKTYISEECEQRMLEIINN